jgi:hypothetical protein
MSAAGTSELDITLCARARKLYIQMYEARIVSIFLNVDKDMIIKTNFHVSIHQPFSAFCGSK